MADKINIRNKKASFDYEFVEKFIAGIVLTGTEIKALREGKASLVDAYCIFEAGELYVKNLNISTYKFGTYNNHFPMRERKLLLKRIELRKLFKRSQEKGFTIVATHLFINDKGWAKLEIALSRGKKEYDKRQTLKNEDSRRELDRVKKSHSKY
jgi:SsrA-binding protein